MKTLGEVIKERRKELNLSLRDLESQVGYDYSYIAKIENGKRTTPSITFLYQISKVLDLNASELVDLTNVDEDIKKELKRRTAELAKFENKSSQMNIDHFKIKYKKEDNIDILKVLENYKLGYINTEYAIFLISKVKPLIKGNKILYPTYKGIIEEDLK